MRQVQAAVRGAGVGRAQGGRINVGGEERRFSVKLSGYDRYDVLALQEVDFTPDAGNQAEDSRLAAALSGPNRWWALLSFFGFGLLLAFTPCVLPMIPILSGLIAGANAAHGGRIGTGRALSLSSVYILANALVFTAAGVVAGLVGANLQAAFQAPWVLVAFALLFVALALSMFGLYELQLPASLRQPTPTSGGTCRSRP